MQFRFKTELRKSKFPIIGKLIYLYRIDSLHLGVNIVCKFFGVACRAFGNVRHVTIDTVSMLPRYSGSLVFGLLMIAMFSERADCLHSSFVELYHGNMLIVMSYLFEESALR